MCARFGSSSLSVASSSELSRQRVNSSVSAGFWPCLSSTMSVAANGPVFVRNAQIKLEEINVESPHTGHIAFLRNPVRGVHLIC